jgi:hypothetical protein
VSKTHSVKSWTHLFEAVVRGEKTHDLRLLDRDYEVGDRVLLREYDWATHEYTGREQLVEVTYITSAQHIPCAFSPQVLHPQHGILSIRKIEA